MIKLLNINLSGKCLSLVVIVSILSFIMTGETYQLIDGVTAASQVIVAPPVLKITATPSMVNNTIKAIAGQPVTITMSATDPNGYNSYVYSGILQNGCFFAAVTGVSSCPSSSAVLPAGAKMQVSGSNNKLVFTWTPDITSTAPLPLLMQFMSYNTYGSQNYAIAQVITIQTSNHFAPVFDSSLSSQQTLVADIPVTIPVIVNAAPDNANVNITADALPSGASLSSAAKNAQGQWVALLSWTPSQKQLGNSSISFTAVSNQQTAQSHFSINFNVLDLTTPLFSGAMPSLQKAVVNSTLNYNVIILPDLHTRNVLLTATGLPAGAVLNKPKLLNGQLIATLVWKPNSSQLNSSPQVTFSAQDNLPGALPVSFTVTFSVLSQ